MVCGDRMCPPPSGGFPVEAVEERRRAALIGLALRQFSRVGAARMIGRDQDPQIPRRGVGMRLAERVDDARRIAAEPRRRAGAQSGLVERQRLGRRPVVERLLGLRVADEQRNVRGQRRAARVPGMARESPCHRPSASSRPARVRAQGDLASAPRRWRRAAAPSARSAARAPVRPSAPARRAADPWCARHRLASSSAARRRSR